jgi:transposase
MTKNQVEVITSVQRRRRWPISEKERIVAEALAPGAVASEVARAAGIHVSQLFRWRQQLCARERGAARFSPVAVVPGPEAVAAQASAPDTVEIEFGNGVRLRISGSVDGSIIKAAVSTLAKIRRRR